MGVGPFEMHEGKYVKVAPKGGRKPEWGNENRKIARAIRRRQQTTTTW